MSLLLTVYDSPDWEAFLIALGVNIVAGMPQDAFIQQSAIGSALSLDELDNLSLILTDTNQLLIGVVQAEFYIAQALIAGRSLDEASIEWEQKTSRLISYQSQNRRQVKLFILHQAMAAPKSFCDSQNGAFTSTPITPQPYHHSLQLLAACQYVAQTASLQRLNTHLQAAALPIKGGESINLNIAQILQEHSANIAAKQQLETNLQSLQGIEEQLKAELTERDEQYKDKCLSLDAVVSQLAATKQQLDNTASMRVQLEQQLQAITGERDSHFRSLQVTQELMESAILEKDARETELSQQLSNITYELERLAALRNQDKVLHEEAISILSSERDALLNGLQNTQELFESVVAENTARHTETCLARDNALSELAKTSDQLNSINKIQTQQEKQLEIITDERDTVLLELQRLQELLEELSLKLQAEQTNNKHALLARDKQHAKEIAKFDLDLRKIKAKAACAEFTAQLLQQEINQLKSSVSWKAAKPVRILGSLVKKNENVNDTLSKEIALLLNSEYFDADWYLITYPDVAAEHVNPAEHYITHGAKEGRIPSPLFDGNWYLEQYPDVANAGENPLIHFILFGQQEGRSSSPKLLADHSQQEEGI